MRINKKQYEAFLPKDDAEFLEFSVDHVMEDCAPNVGRLPRSSVKDMTASGLERARGWGLTDTRALLAFVSVMWEIGPNFDEEPTLRAYLASAEGSPEDRFNRMIDAAPDSAWERAEELRDDTKWYPDLDEDEADFEP
ncbi:MAG: hypothetical protein LGR52_00675 [Candidatus Thiosymbion ectosymbiont of Robbea hypermnestra]|nr:hypothetical protein [Candidatus Thiosymbion ectosymbiont of Robbea hypermnestra]